MTFINKGSIVVGYRLFNEKYYSKVMKNRAIINDFSVINNKVSEFLYEAIDKVQGFGIKKENFLKIIGHRMGK